MNLKEQIAATISRVLEEAVFIFTDELPAERHPGLNSWEARGVELNFSGERSGWIRMWAGNDFLRFAASNMLGIEEDAPDADRKGMDALKEMLNMIVGNVLTDVYGEKPVFDLGLPRSIEPSLLIERDGERIWLAADDHPVLFVAKMDPT